MEALQRQGLQPQSLVVNQQADAKHGNPKDDGQRSEEQRQDRPRGPATGCREERRRRDRGNRDRADHAVVDPALVGKGASIREGERVAVREWCSSQGTEKDTRGRDRRHAGDRSWALGADVERHFDRSWAAAAERRRTTGGWRIGRPGAFANGWLERI